MLAVGWRHTPLEDDVVGTRYRWQTSELEFTFVEERNGTVVVPIPGHEVLWTAEPLGEDERSLSGVRARVIPLELLREMAQKRIAVEICLTSNDLILGVRGNRHPFPVYRKYGAPVVIATDDEGVSRSDMTHEYLRAVEGYGLTYAELKKIVRDSISYSFAEAPLKSKLLADLDARFGEFEKRSW